MPVAETVDVYELSVEPDLSELETQLVTPVAPQRERPAPKAVPAAPSRRRTQGGRERSGCRGRREWRPPQEGQACREGREDEAAPRQGQAQPPVGSERVGDLRSESMRVRRTGRQARRSRRQEDQAAAERHEGPGDLSVMTLMANLRRRRLGRLRSARGSTLIEAALITPLLLLLTFSIVDFGALLYIYLSLESGVSQATRFAITNTATPGMTREQSIMAAMRTATPTLTLPDSAFTFSFMPPGASRLGQRRRRRPRRHRQGHGQLHVEHHDPPHPAVLHRRPDQRPSRIGDEERGDMELKQRLTNHRGQSLVEFALIMPFILLVALGVIEVGLCTARSARRHEADA